MGRTRMQWAIAWWVALCAAGWQLWLGAHWLVALALGASVFPLMAAIVNPWAGPRRRR